MMELSVLIIVLVVNTVTTQDCAVNYTTQPPTEFDCNPTGRGIRLSCVVTPLSTSVSWYYTSDPMRAGLQGDELMDDVDGYSVIDNSIGASRIVNLGFTVSNLTTGFYWCGITSGDYRPSTITPICTQFISMLPMCDLFDVNDQISNVHHYETECAEVDSPTRFPRPDNCVVVPSPSISFSTSTSYHTSSVEFSSSTRSDISDSTSLYTSSTPGVTSDQSSNEQMLLFILIGVCVFLAVVATIICGAITILCFLTRAHQSHDTSTPQDNKSSQISYNPNEESINGISSTAQLDNNQQSPLYSGVYSEPVIKQCDDKDINLIREHAMSFSNPVYEIGQNSIPTPITASQVASPPQTHPIPITPPTPSPQVTLPPPKHLPPSSPTPPIFSDNEVTDSKRCYYAKPDLSKKRSRSMTSSQEKETPPPLRESPVAPPIPPPLSIVPVIEEVVYHNPPNDEHTYNNILPNNIPQSIKPVYIDPVIYDEAKVNHAPQVQPLYSDYDDPDDLITSPEPQVSSPVNEKERFEVIVPAGNESTYDDPWDTLPTGVRRGSTRSRSRSIQPTTNVTSSTQLNSSGLFDDPMYDVPSL